MVGQSKSYFAIISHESLDSLNDTDCTKNKTELEQKKDLWTLRHLKLLEEFSNLFSPPGPRRIQDLRPNIICGPQYIRYNVLDNERDLLTSTEKQGPYVEV